MEACGFQPIEIFALKKSMYGAVVLKVLLRMVGRNVRVLEVIDSVHARVPHRGQRVWAGRGICFNRGSWFFELIDVAAECFRQGLD